MPTLPPPTVPWQITGNHWIAVPCIHPGDASIHAIGLLHRGARSAIEFAGAADFASGTGAPLMRLLVETDGTEHDLGASSIAWERAYGWIPTFTCTVGPLLLRGTIVAPFGRDADVPGIVFAVSLENRGTAPVEARATLAGVLGHRQLRVRTPRPFEGAARAQAVADGIVVLDGADLPGLAAIAIGGESDEEVTVDGASYRITRGATIAPGERVQLAYYLAAGPERDAAVATVGALRRRGWRDLLTATRDGIQSLEQTTGTEAVDRLVNRNLLFAYFFGVGRALDDAHFYLMRTRVPWHGHGVTVRDWDALMWTIPAVLLADPPLGRELLLRMCELHGYAPGRGVHYFDGTLFEPGYSLDAAAAFALAAERYIRDTGDEQVVDEPVLADTLYLVSDEMAARRDPKVPLYSTDATPSGRTAPHRFTLHTNAVVAMALDILRRTLDEESAKRIEEAEVVRSAIRRHFVEGGSKGAFVTSTDLAGETASVDDPSGSVLWLPFYEAVPREDSTYRRTVRALPGATTSMAQLCARLIGPDSSQTLQFLRRAPLDGGVAAEEIGEGGRATGNGGDAALSGLLAWTVWYAVNALGEQP